MVLRRVTVAILFALVALGSLQANTQPEQWFKKSVITLTDLSEVPGMVIEPGTYVLRAEEGSHHGRAEIQLLNQDESQVITTFIAVPDHRQRPASDVVLRFFEGVTEGPRPIQSWYYIGDMNGYEFVYPRPRARQIAKYTEDHVMGCDSRDGAILAITASGTEVPVYEATGNAPTKVAVSDEAKREKPQPATAADRKVKRGRARP